MKYYEKHACGHEGMIELVGPSSQREWRLKKYFGEECPDCQQKHRDEQNAAAAARAAEMELPKLIGTAKQVAWAESIRMNLIDVSEAYAAAPDKGSDPDKIAQIVGCILDNEIYASHWIDRGATRRERFLPYISDYIRENREKVTKYLEGPIPPVATATTASDAASVIRPAEIKHDGIATVELAQTGETTWTIRAFYEKNDDFRSIVTKLHLTWDSAKRCWARNVNFMSGPGEDRAAELISRLIKNGLCVQCDSAPVRELVRLGNYQPENRLWVAFKNENALRFRFDRDEIMNERVRKIGARWDGEGYEIAAAKYNTIEEFARLYGFSVTPKAQAALRAARENVEGATVVDPTVVSQLKAKNNPLAEVLKSSREVLPDLRDE